MSQKFKSEVELQALNAATTDTDKFLVSDGGIIKFRTGAEMLSDLGVNAGASASSIQHQVKAAVAINKGQAVYVSSADGTNMIVSLASNATEATSSKTMGLLASTVGINGFANVVAEGLLAGLDTSTATAGAPVWLGTGGNLIYGLINKPYAPAHLVFIGIVTRVNVNNGEIFVKVQNGFELDELHDVDLKTTTPVNGHILGHNGTLWVNKTIAGWLGYTPYNASNPAGYISSYTETDTLSTVTGRGATTNTSISVGPDLTVYSDNSFNYTASRIRMYSHNNYRGAGVHMSGVDSTWFSGTPYTDFSGGYIISRTSTPNDESSAQYSNALLTITSTGNVSASSSLRAPIFYDSNNTAYYTDPNGTSSLSSVIADNTIRSRKSQTAGSYTSAALWTESYDNTATGVAFHISGNVGKFLEMRTDGVLYWDNNTVWHSGNDGSASGLDADLLDGNHASAFALASHTHAYDNYQYWNLKTNGVQRTTITSNGNLDLVAGTNVSINYGAGGVVTISSTDTNTVYTHPAYTARNIDTSGAQVIDIITSDAIGSVTNITTRTMTLGDLGYTGATNANYYVLPFTDNSTNWNTAYSWGNHAGLYASSSHTHTFDSLTAKTSGTGTYQTTGEFIQNNGKYVRDSYYRTISGRSDLYSGGSEGWYTVAQVTLTGNCSGAVLYGTLNDHRYNGADSYQIAVVARSECDFESNNQSHYVNVGCTILGSTNYTNYRSKIRVVLTTSTTNNRTYQLQFFETAWNNDTWQLESNGWSIWNSPQTASAEVGTPLVNYVSNQNADYQRANTATYSPVFYDTDDTAYYVNANSTSNLASTYIAGHYYGSYNTSNILLKTAANTAEIGILGQNNSGAFKFQIYGNGNDYGFLNGNWAAWDLRKTLNGNIYLNNQSTYYYGGDQTYMYRVIGTADMRTPILYDLDNTGYYIDAASTSSLNALNLAGDLSFGSQTSTWITSNVMSDSIGWNNSYGVYIGSNTLGYSSYIRGNGTFTNNTGTHNLLHADNYTTYTDPRLYRGVNAFTNFQSFVSTPGTVRFDQANATGGFSNAPGGYTYGGVLSLRGDNFGFQLWGSHTGDFYFKTQWQDDQYSGWREVLHSANYTSFAAAASHTHTFDSLTSKSSGTGTYETSGDFRAPIFYDSNDTGYYVNPNLTSRIESVWVRGASAADGKVSIGGASYNSAMNINYDQMWTASGNLHLQYSGVGNIDMNYGGGHAFSRTSLRAPIFYDYNDTAYYGDFNNTSRQYQAISFGDSGRYSAINTTINGAGAGDKLILYGGTSNYDARLLVGADYDMLFKSQGYISGKGSFKFYSGVGSTLAMLIDASQNTTVYGSLTASVDMRTPIVYDSNDTSYSWNPATDTSHRFNTPYGYVDIGPKNGGHCHMYTDRPSFYFNQELDMLGNRVLHAGNYANYAWPLQGSWKPASLSAETRLRGATSPDGGEFGLAYSSGQIYAYVDGFFYQNEGAYRVIDTNSIGSYAPSLTGIGASGTWNINTTGDTTGNAAGIYTTFLGTNTSNIGSGYSRVIRNENGSGGNPAYAPILHLAASDTMWQIAASHGGSTNFVWRSGYAGTWSTPWWSILHSGLSTMSASGDFRAPIFYDSDNTSYYLDPTSTTQINNLRLSTLDSAITWTNSTYMMGSPTHGFRFNDNASSINALIIDNSGNSIAYASHRAPIFYDTNNTGFYMDPTGTSNITKLYHSGNIVATNFGYGQVGLYSSVRYQAVFSMGESYMLPADGTSIGNLYGMAWSHPNAGGVAGNLNTHGLLVTENGSFLAAISGSIRSRDDMRAPIFYDSNNTGYYVDPAGTSNFYDLNISGASNKYLYINPGNGYEAMVRYNGGSGSGWYVGKRTGAGINSTADFRFYSEAVSGDVFGISTSGTAIAGGDMRAPIFYDSNDTTYYINPADSTTSANFAGKVQFNYGGASSSTLIQTTGSYGTMGINTYYGVLHTTGNFYIGNPAGGAADLTANNANFSILYDRANTAYYFDGNNTGDSIRVAGDIVAYYSDDRLKDRKGNIENAIEKVLSLNGFYYEANQKAQELGYKKKMEVGVSAQEVEAILPELIKDAPIGQGYKTLDYGRLTPLLIEAIKEQQKQIEELKELVNKLITK